MHLRHVLLAAAVSTGTALNLGRVPTAASRRAVCASLGLSLAALAPALPAHAVKETGYAAAKEVSNTQILADTPRDAAGVRLGGTYSDPLHPGCPRKLVLAGASAIVTGADEDGKPWKVKGLVKGARVLLDFTPKGGPKDVLATYTNGKGLVFPDGNVWKKQ